MIWVRIKLYIYLVLGNGNPPQCSCLENPRDGGAWWAAVCGVAQSWTRQKWLSSRQQFSCNCFSFENSLIILTPLWDWRYYFFFQFFLKFIYFNWRLITLQYCGGFCHTLTWISHEFTCVPHPELPFHLPLHTIPQGHPSAPTLSTLSHASNLDWWSVSHMIIYMFQCHSPKSSHPCPLW